MADRDIKMQKVIKKMKAKKPTNITNKFDGSLICKALKMQCKGKTKL